jgi:hypothetical protein
MSESGVDDCVGGEKWEARRDGVGYSDLRHHFAYLALPNSLRGRIERRPPPHAYYIIWMR